MCFRGHRSNVPKDDKFMSLKTIVILANDADPDKMPPYAAFHLCLHCLSE